MTDTPSSSSAEVNAGGQALYRRFRAQTFSQIIGQDAVVQTLRNAVRLGRVGHGFLFVGPRGTGKTSMARIMAKAVNCTDLLDGEPCDQCANCVSIRDGRALDVVELDAASNNKVDDMRELLPRVYTGAADLQHKVFIIDEVQRIKEGWDVLLKTLEEPPDGVLFIFCTTDPSQIRPAVVSRLQRFTFRPLAVPEIEGKLQRILETEGRSVDPAAITLVAQLADGGMRDAESMLDQVLVSADDPITAASIQDLLGLADEGLVDGFIDALVEGDVIAGITILDGLEGDGRDLVAFSEQLVTRLRAALVERMSLKSAGDRATARPLTLAARRLTGVDASRSGLGGFRWQLELCLFAAAEDGAAANARAPVEVPPVAAPARSASPTAASPAEAASPTDPAAPAKDGAALARPVAATETALSPMSVAPSPDLGAVAPSPAPVAPSPAPVAPALARTDAGLDDGESSPAQPSAGSGAAPTDGRSPDIAEVRAAWPRIVAAIGNNPANRPLVTTCRPVESRDGFLVLGFPEDQAFMRDIAERKRSILEDGISSVVGHSVAVRCVVTNLELVEPVDSGEGDLVSQAKRIFDGDLDGVDDIE
jgi:DNA polymerase-3 subunit gamma/tau